MSNTPTQPALPASTGSAMKDADGMIIRLGSVLRNIHDGDQGVVVRVMKYGDVGIRWLDAVGDIHIQSSPGSVRVTNKYHLWRHVPRAQQSFRERHLSWFNDPDAYQYNCLDEQDELTDAERKAITGIMALLPEEIVDWESGPWPDTVEDALRFLVDYLSSPNAQGSGTPEDKR